METYGILSVFQSSDCKETYLNKAYIFTAIKFKNFHLFIKQNGIYLPTYMPNL